MNKQLQKLAKKCRVLNKIDDIRIKLPQSKQNFEVLDKEMRINILKFHKFMKTVVNPASVVSLIESLDSVLLEDVRLTTK
mgnify:CR=1 FL=1